MTDETVLESEESAAPAAQRMSLQELKDKSPTDLLALAEALEIENASTMRKQDMMFAILKTLADDDVEITAAGSLEVLQDGFGFLRSPEANYLPGPDDIYVSPSQIRRFGLRTGDTVDGVVRSPREGERYFALVKVDLINFEDPENVRHKVHFDNLTPLYPDQRLSMELEDPTLKDRSGRVIDIVAPLGKGPRCLLVAPPRVGKPVILQDSFSRLGRAYYTVVPSSVKVLSGGGDANALQRPKRFFGAARNIEEGGSRTIIATALVETGSRMDDVIYEEFKGTGNNEIHLDRKIAEKRIYPAINITRSGTRREALLTHPDALQKMWILRKLLHPKDELAAMEFMLDKLKATKTNSDFFDAMKR